MDSNSTDGAQPVALVTGGSRGVGVATVRLLERKAPGTTAGWQSKTGTLPQGEDIAAGIVAAVEDASLPTGHTVVVGTPLETLDDG
jgi:hypothetical protein